MDSDEFLSIVKSACASLRQNGYSLDAATVDVQPTYTSMIIPGRNWTITFTCDFRDDTVDCYVRHAGDDAHADKSLIGFLVDNFHYRGGGGSAAPAAETFDARVRRLVHRYVFVIEHQAAPVWRDQPITNPASR